MFTPYINQPSHIPIQGRSFALVSVLILALILSLSFGPLATPGNLPAPAISLEQVQLPLAFVPNLGQTNAAVHFQAHDLGRTLYFTKNSVVLVLPVEADSAPLTAALEFKDANAASLISGGEYLSGVVNYIVGDDPASWRTNLPTFSSITYRELYPGIDLHYDGASGQLKGTYTVAPGADPAQIRWHFAGAAALAIDRVTGDLLVKLASVETTLVSSLVERAPVAWQEVNGQRVPVTARYVLEGGYAGFALGAYNPRLPLVIDPTLVYSTYLGGSNFDTAEGMVIDSHGNVYVTGTTGSHDFISGAVAGEDAYVLKINAAGSALVYSTILGGSIDDEGTDIGIDSAGQAYITGYTDSPDFPTQNAAQSACSTYFGACTGEAFLAKLSADGSALLYSTYHGGSMGEDAEGVAVVDAENVYIVGSTSSANFPTRNALQPALGGVVDAFVARFDTTKNGIDSLVYSTYLGGSLSDYGSSIAVDVGGNVYLSGNTISTNFPTQAAFQATNHGNVDTFLVKLNPSGSSLVYSTYLGGSGEDNSYDIAVDGSGQVHVTGSTTSTNFPTHKPLQSTNLGWMDVFVTKLNAGGSALVYSTYLGGESADLGYGITTDGLGNAYVTGNTSSATFPMKDTLQAYGGDGDAFITKLNAGGELLYGTLLGGAQADYGDSVAVDGSGNAYVAGFTFSTDFPTLNPLQPANKGSTDLFVAKINDAGGGVVVPPPAEGPNLEGSTKFASQQTLAPGQSLEYTIRLLNNGTLPATVTVTDPVPAELAYMTGTASHSGTYNESNQTLTWSGIVVPVGSAVSLTFSVQPAMIVDDPTTVMNQATITVGDTNLLRLAGIVLLPEVEPGPKFAGAYKSASQHSLGPDEDLTYTIRIYNSGTEAATASVTDTVPVELAYLAGSVSGGGVYNEQTHTITWSDIVVPSGAGVSLTFEVEPAMVVAEPVEVINTAIINFNGETFQRSARIALLPVTPSSDRVPPVVESLTIADTDILTDPAVMLHIQASDDVGIRWMFLREWQLSTAPFPRWEVIQESGWVPFQEHYPWTLGDQDGTHFVGVWVADSGFNLSRLGRQAMDFASLVRPGATVPLNGLVPYMVYYPAGVEVTVTLTPTEGDADLYVWYPGNSGIPDRKSTLPEQVADTFTFTTPQAGVYLFLVHGYTEATYNLAFSDPGGNNAPVVSTAIKPGLGFDPVLPQSGLDPLSSSSANPPAGPTMLFVPMVRR